MADVSFRNVAKRFGPVSVIEGLDLDVADREFLVLLGPSGCGKTTLMRVLAGLETASAGEVFIGGRRVDGLPPRDRDVAMVFQSYALYPHMTVRENIEYPLRIRRLDAATRRAEVEAAAATVELDLLLDRLPRQLSGGQRQRVALARAIVRRPQVFLMDEPLSNLDAKLRVKMRSELKHLHHQLGITTIYVTHDQTEALTLADRIAVMSQGRILQLAPPRTLYDRPANVFVAGFVGSPAMNFLPGRLEAGDFVAEGVRVAGAGAGSRPDLVLGFRPEHTTLAPEDGAADLRAELYSVEVTGESALGTARFGRELLTFTVDRDYPGRIGTPVGLRIDPARIHLFDAATGERAA